MAGCHLRYCVGAHIADETGTTSATLFDSAMRSILSVPCREMVITRGFENPRVIPEDLHTIRGQTRLMHVQYTNNSYDFKINRILPPRADNPAPAGSITVTPSTPPETSPPPSPASKSTDASTHASSAKRQLFDEPGISDTWRIRYKDY